MQVVVALDERQRRMARCKKYDGIAINTLSVLRETDFIGSLCIIPSRPHHTTIPTHSTHDFPFRLPVRRKGRKLGLSRP